MKYILINPVVDRMYETQSLDIFLTEHGYHRVYCKTDWASVVREKYRAFAEQCDHTIVDMRCPMACQIPMEMSAAGVVFPEIEPILIHCAREISEIPELDNQEKLITTPCRSLADQGNALGLADTQFLSWNDFLDAIGCNFPSENSCVTPIPLGFFTSLGGKQAQLTTEEKIRAYFGAEIPPDEILVEMLYCEHGCHNGDGVVR